jgi:DNA-binding transcriptional ArsR family regulator
MAKQTMAKHKTDSRHTHSPLSPRKGAPGVPEEGMNEIVRIFQALSDLTRVKVVYVLTQGEQSVNDLADAIGASPSGVSHHLRRLKDAGVVTFHRHGNQVFYSIEDAHLAAILNEAWNHVEHTRPSGFHLRKS